MRSTAGPGIEGLTAVVGTIEPDSQDVDVALVGGIDADLAEVKRPRVEAVDPPPRFTAVGRFVDAAGLKSIFALPILHVFVLPAQAPAERPASSRINKLH